MLKIHIIPPEHYDEEKEEFVQLKPQILQLEHSLVSLSKWESKWKMPFLGKEQKTLEETIDYIKCMVITQNVPDDIYDYLSNENINQVNDYIKDGMTATTFSNNNKGNNREIVTAEIIYYWMISLNIPFECQKWHLNRLLTLINVCNIKNAPPKKVGKKSAANSYAAINAARRQQYNSKG